jgi:hypothetical protein
MAAIPSFAAIEPARNKTASASRKAKVKKLS